MEAQIYRVASSLSSVAGAILVHGSMATAKAADLLAGNIGSIISVGIGVVGIALVFAGLLGGSGLLRDYPGKASLPDEQASSEA